MEQNNTPAYRGEEVKRGGGVVLDLQIEIFTYKFCEGFCREGDEFYANIMM